MLFKNKPQIDVKESSNEKRTLVLLLPLSPILKISKILTKHYFFVQVSDANLSFAYQPK